MAPEPGSSSRTKWISREQQLALVYHSKLTSLGRCGREGARCLLKRPILTLNLLILLRLRRDGAAE